MSESEGNGLTKIGKWGLAIRGVYLTAPLHHTHTKTEGQTLAITVGKTTPPFSLHIQKKRMITGSDTEGGEYSVRAPVRS